MVSPLSARPSPFGSGKVPAIDAVTGGTGVSGCGATSGIGGLSVAADDPSLAIALVRGVTTIPRVAAASCAKGMTRIAKDTTQAMKDFFSPDELRGLCGTTVFFRY